MRRRWLVGLVVATLVGAFGATPTAAAPAPVPTARYIVQLDGVVGGLVATATHLLEDVGLGGAVVETLDSIGGVVVDLPPGVADLLAALPGVTGVEADHLMTVAGTQPNAPYDLDRIDQRLRPLSGTYDYGATGAGVTAYVIDTGIRASHRDFGGRVVAGVDTVDGSPSTQDCAGHGTHVAGLLGGTTYGAAKAVRLVSVRVFGCDQSTATSEIIEGIDWVIANHQVGQPAVANLSLGGEPSRALDDAVRAMITDGVTVAVAAGNENVDACSESPGRVAEVLTVAATDSRDARAPFSNYGPCVDLQAPGVDIVSASFKSDTDGRVASGTSMSAPLVSGAAALYLQGHPTASPAAVTAAITRMTTPNVISGLPRTCNVLQQLLGGCPGYRTPNRLLYVGSGPVVTPPPPRPCNDLEALLGIC